MTFHIIVPPSIYADSLSWDKTLMAPFEGSAIVATVLKQSFPDIEVECIDLRAEPRSLDSIVDSIGSDDILHIAGSPDGYQYVKQLSLEIRKKNIPIVLGGCLSTISWKTVLSQTGVTHCLIGDCENSLPELTKCLLTNQDTLHLPVATKDLLDEQIVLKNYNNLGIPDMENVPCPDYSLWRRTFENSFFESAAYSTQRGCPNRCKFCANPFGKHFRVASNDKIRADLQNIKKQGFKHVYINDPTFNTSEKRVLDVCGLMMDMDFEWSALIRATPFSKSQAKALKASGCKTLLLGIESTDQGILDNYAKGISLDDATRCVNIAYDEGLAVIGTFILGLPGETYQTLSTTLKYISDSKFIPRAFYAAPFPGTGLFRLLRNSDDFAAMSDIQFEEMILCWMSQQKYDVNDDIFPMPDRDVSVSELRSAMKLINEIQLARVREQDIYF